MGQTSKISILIIAFLIYSLSSVLSKFASLQDFTTIFCLSIFCILILMGIYAILWQKILTFMQLNYAFLCKSITIVIIMLLSVILFNEKITLCNIIGTAFIVLGLIILAWKK